MRLRDLTEQAEIYMTDLMAGRRHAPLDKFVRAGLWGLSRVYLTLVRWRLSLYRHRFLRDHRLGCLVISIGNLTVGGTGKTPVVEIFARTLMERNRRVAILSRGYKSKSKPVLEQILDKVLVREDTIPPRVVSNGEELLLDSHMSGDEPFMLAKNLKTAVVLVDKNRVKSGRYAIRNFQADTLILDDGFQYLFLKPRLNILLIKSLH